MAKKATMNDLVDIKNCYMQSGYEFRPSYRNELEDYLTRHIRDGHCYWDYGAAVIAWVITKRGENTFDPSANVGDLMIVSIVNGTDDQMNLDRLLNEIYDEHPGATCYGRTKKTNIKMITRFNRRFKSIQTKEMGDYILYWWKIEDVIK